MNELSKICTYIFKDLIYLFLETWEGRGKREGENIDV